jgi:HEAT repeat protein
MTKHRWTQTFLVGVFASFLTGVFADDEKLNPSVEKFSLVEKQKDAWREFVRAEAKAGRGKAQVSSLETILDDPTSNLRDDAASLLGDIGTDAASAVPCLMRNLDDPNARVRAMCVLSLGQIGPRACGHSFEP